VTGEKRHHVAGIYLPPSDTDHNALEHLIQVVDTWPIGCTPYNVYLQQAIERLAGLFERVGLKTNTSKTEAMTCTPGPIKGMMSTEAYKRNRGVDGSDSFRQRQRRRVECSECGASMALNSLPHHLRSQHGIATDTSLTAVSQLPPDSYRTSFPKTLPIRLCPVEGCSGSARSWDNLRRHFCHRHPDDTLCILEEAPTPLPKCELCGMHVKPNAIRGGHQTSLLCKRGAARLRQRKVNEEARLAREQVFTIYGEPLQSVIVFKYLGRPLSSTDDDWPALYRNLSRARKRWGQVRRVLTRDGATPKISGMFYKAIVQSVLLYGCETWTITPRMLTALRGFHHQVARRIAVRLPNKLRDGSWNYPRIEVARSEAGLYTIEHYIAIRQSGFVDKVAIRPIKQLCDNATRRSGDSSRLYWWTQQTLELDEEAQVAVVSDQESDGEQE